MQECFREHPDVYGAELEDEEAEASIDAQGETPQESDSTVEVTSELASPPKPPSPPTPPHESDHPDAKTERAKAATKQVTKDHDIQAESEELVPKAAHDATTSEAKK